MVLSKSVISSFGFPNKILDVVVSSVLLCIQMHTSRKHVSEMYSRLNPMFYRKNLGCGGVYLVYLLLLKNRD